MRIASSAGRPLQHAAVATNSLVLDTGAGVSRKELSRVCRMAEEALELKPSARLVLSMLVANWGEQTWERLLVWPSNETLTRRTGLSERTLRTTFRQLIGHGLIAPRESPNGKRYAIRNSAGTVVNAYGFDLTPLYAGRARWEALVTEKKAERLRIRHAFDTITVARRATEEALEALASRFPDAPTDTLKARYEVLRQRTPRRSTKAPSADVIEAWMTLRADVENAFFHAGNDGEICRHNESNPESPGEACHSVPPRENDESAADEPNRNDIILSVGERGRSLESLRSRQRPRRSTEAWRIDQRALPVVIADACPAALQYGGSARSVPEMIALGQHLRAMLGAGPSVWSEAQMAIGPMRAALAVIYVVQLYEDDARRHGGETRIQNPGGYLRAFVRLVASGRIDLEAELLAMRRRRMK